MKGRIPVSEESTNPCTGETVTWEGWLQHQSNGVVDAGRAAGGGLSEISIGEIAYVVQLRGTSDSGAKYILHQSATESFTIHFPSGDDVEAIIRTETIRYPVTIIRQGEDGTRDDYGGQLLWHFTRNADGEVTAQVDVVNAECR